MIQIRTYQEGDQAEVIALVLHCQNDGTRPFVTVDDQPELRYIPEIYLETEGSHFWVAEENGRVVGSIGLKNYGNGLAILKKFFVYEPYRGTPHNLGRRLYAELLAFAKNYGVNRLILDTPQNTDRAHKFYEKAGFQKIEKEQLPVTYEYPYSESHFFYLEIK